MKRMHGPQQNLAGKQSNVRLCVREPHCGHVSSRLSAGVPTSRLHHSDAPEVKDAKRSKAGVIGRHLCLPVNLRPSRRRRLLKRVRSFRCTGKAR
jgi:hypothetical protein